MGYGVSNCGYGYGEGTTRYGVAGLGEVVWTPPKAEEIETAPTLKEHELELQLQEVL